MDLYLDPVTHDLQVGPAGLVRLTSGVPEAAAQRLLIMLRMFAGEWFLDLTAGIPYYESILVKNPDLAAVRAILVQKIQVDTYVSAVTRLSLALDSTTRVMSCDFAATLKDGSEISILTGLGAGGGLVDTTLVINGVAITVDGEDISV